MKQPFTQKLAELKKKRKEITDKNARKELDRHIKEIEGHLEKFLVGKQIRVDID